MLLKLICAAGSALLLADAAAAQDTDPMATTYANTITIEIPGLYSARQYIEPDHTWRIESGYGDKRGTWRVADGKVCLAQTEPPGPTLCHPADVHKVGDSWVNSDPDSGQTVIIGLAAGRK